MRQLLEAYDVTNLQTNAVLRKLFLDKLPAQAHTILAGSLKNDLDSFAFRTNEIMAALSQKNNTFHSSFKQQLINEIFDQKLNKIIAALQFYCRPSYDKNRRAPPKRHNFYQPKSDQVRYRALAVSNQY